MSEGESVHEKLKRVRKPRVHIRWEPEPESNKTELPYVVGVLGDFSGHPTEKLPPLTERRFIHIDRDNYNEVLKRFTPGLNLNVDNVLKGDGSQLTVSLRFNSLDDFSPANIARQVQPLAGLLDASESRDAVDVLWLQLSKILHHPAFQELEAAWRGLYYLVINSETNTSLKIKVLNCNKRTLHKDLDSTSEFTRSQIFKKVYESEVEWSGEPYGALVGDYQFTNHPEDVALLQKMSQVAAFSFAPFITSPSPELFGFDAWTDLSKTHDLGKTFDSSEYHAWNAFRDSEESRFVVMAMPRMLARLPYGSRTNPVVEFAYEEAPLGPNGESIAGDHETYCWMNTAYTFAARLTNAFSKTGFCTAICGGEQGKVEGLPMHTFTNIDGFTDVKCPIEARVDESREAELSKLGFMPLVHFSNTDHAAFYGAHTCHKPKRNDLPEATVNECIAARLPCVMATSRFMHYLIVLVRRNSYMARTELEAWLQWWISDYVFNDPDGDTTMRLRKPLREAQVKVVEVPNHPNEYGLICYLRPWLQMDDLFYPIRNVARVTRKRS